MNSNPKPSIPDTMKYAIEVHSAGYTDHTKIVEAPSLRIARQSERQAKIEWCEANDIDLDSNFEMPFIRITKPIAKTQSP